MKRPRPILKKHAFGLATGEDNHGEDVEECDFYLDSTSTHSHMKYRCKYPQAACPNDDLAWTDRRGGRHEPTHDLPDIGVFDEGRHFGVFAEHARAAQADGWCASRWPTAAPTPRPRACCPPCGSAAPGCSPAGVRAPGSGNSAAMDVRW